MKTQEFTPLKRVNSITKTKHGLIASVDDEFLRVDVIDAELVRIKISVGGEFDEQPTYAVAANPKLGKRFAVKTKDGVTLLFTGEMYVRIRHEPFAFDVRHKDRAIFEPIEDEEGAWG